MKENQPKNTRPISAGLSWAMTLGVACLVVLLFALLVPRPGANSASSPGTSTPNNESNSSAASASSAARISLVRRYASPPEPGATAEEIVSQKLAKFAKSRRDLVHALAKHFNVAVPPEVDRFFAAVESGNWDEIDAAHAALLAPGQGLNQPNSADLHKIWRGIQETWGAARAIHDWPAQRLLDYGDAVLGTLKPGMIYVGGTDPGCFIPTFMNETSDGEKHITMTQNALADGTYLDYLNFLYGGQMNMLTQEDSQKAFQNYTADAQKRLEHDEQFPNEPKQILPGENVSMADGKVQVSGQVAVMAINEKLFQMLMDKNPDASFAMEESFPFKSTFAQAAPLGPIMELRVQDPQNALTQDSAAQSVDYWRATADQLASEPADSDPRKAYSKMISSQAGLLLDQHFASQAEQDFIIADNLCPSSPEVVFRYVNLLADQKRFSDAIPVVERAIQDDPSNQQFGSLLDQLKSQK